ncbi:MAG: hypothetical protein AAFR17_11320 [Pseudomonadota bacterium]
MADSAQKLTVKMPWSHKLVRAEVQELHVGPGTRVAPEEPVLTLVSADGKHVIRAAHSGRLVPLVSPGDPIIGGDPLYVLRREDEARHRSPVLRGAEGAPLPERRERFAGLTAFAERFGHWGWFILAIGAYALAARLLIPRLQDMLGGAGPEAWMWLLAASIGAGLLLFGAFAQLGRGWPKRMTWGLAACWAGLSAVALTDLPDRMRLPVEMLDVTGAELAAAIGLAEEEPAEVTLAQAPDPEVAAPAPDTPLESADAPAVAAPVPDEAPIAAEGPEQEVEPVIVARLDLGSEPGTGDAVLRSGVSASGAPSPVAPLDPLAADALPESVDAPTAAALAGALPQPGGAQRLADGPEPVGPGAEPALALVTDLTRGLAEPAAQGEGGVLPEIAAAIPDALPGTMPAPQGEPKQAPFQIAALDPGQVEDPSPPRFDAASPATTLLSAPAGLESGDAPTGDLGWAEPQADIDTLSDAPGVPEPGIPGPGPDLQEAGVFLSPLDRAPQERLALADPAAPLQGTGLTDRLAPEPEGPLAKVDATAITAPVPPSRSIAVPRLSGRSETPRLALATVDPAAEPAPLPWLQPRYATVSLLFQFLEDPRSGSVPKIGDSYEAALPQDVALAVRRSEVVGFRPMVQVTGWCRAARGVAETREDRQVALSDRLRLVLVELEIEADTVGMLSDVLPIFGGQDVGFFHNRRPMMGGWSGPQLLDRGEAWMQSRSNRQLDPNYPTFSEGGTYYFSADQVSEALQARDCSVPIWQGGSPATAMGVAVNQALIR